jgi:hypothetical protein
VNAQENIRTNLNRIMDDGQVNATAVWKGYSRDTGLWGWHYVPFGQSAVFLGNSLTAALAAIDDIATERAEVR